MSDKLARRPASRERKSEYMSRVNDNIILLLYDICTRFEICISNLDTGPNILYQV